MGNSESRPSPGEDRHRGAHGGNRSTKQAREDQTVRSSQAAGKDPGRESTPMRIAPEEHVVRGPRRNPVSDSSLERRPPNWVSHERGWRAGDPDADSIVPGREFGAGGIDDGPNAAGGDASKRHPR